MILIIIITVSTTTKRIHCDTYRSFHFPPTGGILYYVSINNPTEGRGTIFHCRRHKEETLLLLFSSPCDSSYYQYCINNNKTYLLCYLLVHLRPTNIRKHFLRIDKEYHKRNRHHCSLSPPHSRNTATTNFECL